MEYRRLISFGKSSFVISLPKTWIVRNKLKKGSLLYINESESNLIISPKQEDADEETVAVINVDGKDYPRITREVNAAYILNNRKIKFEGKELEEKSEKILESVRQLIALEVMELDSTKIVTKDFLDMNKTSTIELIRKMDIIIRNMIHDCQKCFETKTSDNIELRDKDVNRLSFLIYRTIRNGFHNQSMMLKQHNMRAIDLLNQYLLTFHLENIADEAKRISRAITKIDLTAAQQKKFLSLLSNIEEVYLQNVKAFYSKSPELGLEYSSQKNTLIEKTNAFYDSCQKNDHTSYLIDRFRRLVGSVHEMGRLSYQY